MQVVICCKKNRFEPFSVTIVWCSENVQRGTQSWGWTFRKWMLDGDLWGFVLFSLLNRHYSVVVLSIACFGRLLCKGFRPNLELLFGKLLCASMSWGCSSVKAAAVNLIWAQFHCLNVIKSNILMFYNLFHFCPLKCIFCVNNVLYVASTHFHTDLLEFSETKRASCNLSHIRLTTDSIKLSVTCHSVHCRDRIQLQNDLNICIASFSSNPFFFSWLNNLESFIQRNW